jgi:hypothetical protein
MLSIARHFFGNPAAALALMQNKYVPGSSFAYECGNLIIEFFCSLSQRGIPQAFEFCQIPA